MIIEKSIEKLRGLVLQLHLDGKETEKMDNTLYYSSPNGRWEKRRNSETSVLFDQVKQVWNFIFFCFQSPLKEVSQQYILAFSKFNVLVIRNENLPRHSKTHWLGVNWSEIFLGFLMSQYWSKILGYHIYFDIASESLSLFWLKKKIYTVFYIFIPVILWIQMDSVVFTNWYNIDFMRYV